jgi:UDP-glucose 4-epimerase
MLIGEQAHDEVFNIGSHEEISMLGLANRVREMTDSEPEIHLIPYDEAYEAGFEDMPRRVPDTSKIDTAVGWSPTRSLDEILEDVMNFHQAEAAVV